MTPSKEPGIPKKARNRFSTPVPSDVKTKNPKTNGAGQKQTKTNQLLKVSQQQNRSRDSTLRCTVMIAFRLQQRAKEVYHRVTNGQRDSPAPRFPPSALGELHAHGPGGVCSLLGTAEEGRGWTRQQQASTLRRESQARSRQSEDWSTTASSLESWVPSMNGEEAAAERSHAAERGDTQRVGGGGGDQ